MYLYLSIYLSISLYEYASFSIHIISIYLKYICLSIFLYLSINLSVRLCVRGQGLPVQARAHQPRGEDAVRALRVCRHLSVSPWDARVGIFKYICISACLSIYLSVYLSYLYVYLSIYLLFHLSYQSINFLSRNICVYIFILNLNPSSYHLELQG